MERSREFGGAKLPTHIESKVPDVGQSAHDLEYEQDEKGRVKTFILKDPKTQEESYRLVFTF